MKPYMAVGYHVLPNELVRNGNVEFYGDKKNLADAVSSWEYTHRLHAGNATCNIRGIANCPKCGTFAIVPGGV